jgi:hypothetical protein
MSNLFENLTLIVPHLDAEGRPDTPARSVFGVGATLCIEAPLPYDQAGDVFMEELHTMNISRAYDRKAAPVGPLP